MALSDVRKHLFEKISTLLKAYAVDYIKWDHNRVLPFPDSAQTKGIYELLTRLRESFPEVEIESCSSGGGRIDFGILEVTGRVWLSDSNDALERLRIQHDAALFLPLSVTGSHVGPRTCHTSGRSLDIRLRSWVAAQRHMGFEMDPRELTEERLRCSKWSRPGGKPIAIGCIALTFCGSIVRILRSLPNNNWQRMAERFVVFAGKAATSNQILPRPLRLTGLEPSARYRVELINKEDSVGLSRGEPALKTGPLELSGAYLMQHGLALPWSFPDVMWVVEGQKL